ncbi:MAG TPA: ABC transporter permease [Ferruginibacter sp.]|nr:ABC transporter permease [Ferruginibacter sp.]
MIKNYLKIAFRSIARHKGYAAINITGLAVGMAACLLLFLVVRYEVGYDKFQPNYNRIYHVVTQDKYADGITYNSGIPVPALEAMRLEVPNAVFAGINSIYGGQVTVGGTNENTFTDKKFIETYGMFFCEPQFFQVFDYKWLTGTAAVLKEPNSAVLTKKMAEKYFGSWQEATGKFVKLDNAITLKVSGILEDVKEHSDFPLGILISFETLKRNGENYNYNATSWGSTSSNFQVFALLKDKAAAATVNQQLVKFSKDHYLARGSGVSVKSHFVEPLSNLHFDNRFESFGNHVTSKSTLWTLSLIGIFIIIMACINFINLATAQAVGRSKEVGIRKVLGSSRKQLFLQVMGETGIVVTIAGIAAIGIALACLPLIKHVASITEQLSLLNIETVFFLAAVIIVVTLFSGLYPSLILSGFKPALALKNKITSAKVGGISLRRGLVVTQFAISQVLIIGTIVAISQMNFVQRADLGFNKEAVLLLSGNADSSVIAKQDAFKQKLLQTPGIQSVSFSSDAPSSDNNWSTNFAFDHRDDQKFQLSIKLADEDYFKTFGLEFLAGRVYAKSDTIREVVINETLVKKLGLKDPGDAIGKDIRMGRSPWTQVVGVVKDFKTSSLRESVRPLVIGPRNKYYSLTAIKLRSSNIPQTQADVQSAWDSFFPEYAYTNSFMEENINNFYQQENQLSLLYKIFAILALLISSLGLYGLVSFMAVQKTKEVGIRKVLGASVGNIVYLFSKEFTILISIAFVIAAPLAYFMMKSWLQDFEYRIELGVGVFIIAVMISVTIAWATVGYKAVKAAIANPVKSLRTE